MNLRVESPEKKKRTTKDSSPPPSFSSLPDEIVVNCLARISRSYYPTLSTVSKSFRSILSFTELYAARSHFKSTEQFIYVCLRDPSSQFPQWFILCNNPNRTLPNSKIKKKRRKKKMWNKKKKKKKTTGQMLVPVTSSSSPCQPDSVVVGSEIYVIGGPLDMVPWSSSSAVRFLDCRSHTWRDAPSMIVPRRYASACLYYEKIYVMGGLDQRVHDDKSWAEVFDTKAQTWELLPDPGTEVRKGYTRRITECQGKIYFENRINTYAYDTRLGKWECCDFESEMFSSTTCVIENVLYRYWNNRYMCVWYDIKNGNWEKVKGLDLLGDKYKRNGGKPSGTTKLVSCGGKLFLFWQGSWSSCSNFRIWCAEIVLEKRDGGEVWGKTQWVDVVHKTSTCHRLLHGLVVSV